MKLIKGNIYTIRDVYGMATFEGKYLGIGQSGFEDYAVFERTNSSKLDTHSRYCAAEWRVSGMERPSVYLSASFYGQHLNKILPYNFDKDFFEKARIKNIK